MECLSEKYCYFGESRKIDFTGKLLSGIDEMVNNARCFDKNAKNTRACQGIIFREKILAFVVLSDREISAGLGFFPKMSQCRLIEDSHCYALL